MNESNETPQGQAAEPEPSKADRLRERWKTEHGRELHDKILHAILDGKAPEDWVGWLEGLPYLDDLAPRDEEPFPRDLRGFNFSRQKLVKAELSHTILDHVIFDNANLDDARMRGCSIEGGSFKRASMVKTHLWNSWLQNSKLAYADLTQADLGDVNLRGSDLWWARLDEANLRGADLGDANLCWARMPMADLWGTNIQGAKFEGTNLMNIKVNDDTNWGLIYPKQTGSIWQKLSNAYWGSPAPHMYLEERAEKLEDFKIARDVYRQAYEACKDAGLRDHASWFFYRSQVCRRRSKFKRWTAGWMLEYFVFDCVSGYGERPRWVIMAMFTVILFFGVLNWIGGMYGGLTYAGEEFRNIGFFGGFYFSIVSFTTVGYGDISPNHATTLGQFLRFADVFESLLGALLISLALVTYTRIAIRD